MTGGCRRASRWVKGGTDSPGDPKREEEVVSKQGCGGKQPVTTGKIFEPHANPSAGEKHRPGEVRKGAVKGQARGVKDTSGRGEKEPK